VNTRHSYPSVHVKRGYLISSPSADRTNHTFIRTTHCLAATKSLLTIQYIGCLISVSLELRSARVHLRSHSASYREPPDIHLARAQSPPNYRLPQLIPFIKFRRAPRTHRRPRRDLGHKMASNGAPGAQASQPQAQIQPCRYKTGKTLGAGSYSVVKECVHIDTGRYYAAKVINKRLMAGREHMVRTFPACKKTMLIAQR
jgi:hypothetical protein